MAQGRLGIAFRDWLNARDVRRMTRRRQFPDTLERAYWDRTEYSKDSARLEAVGYVVASETDNEPYLSAEIPAAGGGVGGMLKRRISRRVPDIHVIYRRHVAGGPRS